MIHTSRSIPIFYGTILPLFVLFSFARGALLQWDTSEDTGIQSGDGIWSSTRNFWSDGTDSPPTVWPAGVGNAALFGGDNGNYTITVNASQQVDSIIFITDEYLLQEGELTSTSDLTIDVHNGIHSTISSFLTISGSLVKKGNGICYLSGDNTIGNAIHITGGILSVASENALGTAGTPVTVHNGGALDINSHDLQTYAPIIINGRLNGTAGALVNYGTNVQYNAFRTVTLENNAAIGSDGMRFDIGRANRDTIGIIGNGFVLTKLGDNEISLLARATGIDSVTILGGTLIQERTDALSEAPVFIANGATLSSYNSISLDNRIRIDSGSIRSSMHPEHITTYTGMITVTNHCFLENLADNSVIVTGTFNGAGTIQKTGKGKWIFTGSNTHTGGTLISGGTLQIGNGTASGSLTGNITVDDTLIFNRSDPVAFPATLSGNGVFIKEGDTSITFTSDNPFSGTTVINNGMIHIGRNGTIGSIGGTIINNGILRFNRSDSIFFDGPISGNGRLVKWGTGTLVLTADNSYSGGTHVETGTLQIGNGATTGNIIGDVENDNRLVFKRSDPCEYDGSISGNGTVIQAGNGTLRLNGNHTFTGSTLVRNGTLELNGRLTMGNQVYIKTGATLSGTGNIGDTMFAENNATINPGNDRCGTLTTASTHLSPTTNLIFDFNGSGNHDVFAINGEYTHTLAGHISIRTREEAIDTGTFTIIRYTGSLIDDTPDLTLDTRALPQQYQAELIYSVNSVAVHIAHSDDDVPLVTDSLPRNIALLVGDTLTLTAGASGNNLSYTWLETTSPGDRVSDDSLLVINGVTIADNGRSFYCKITNSGGYTTSDTVTLTVVQKVAISSQPESDTVIAGKTIQLYFGAIGTTPFTYTWYKKGIPDPVGTDSLLTFSPVAFSDSGTYFCIVDNGFGSATTENFYLAVVPPAPVAAFSISPKSAQVPHMVQFSDQSLGKVTQWSWDFGDGETSDEQSPRHTYKESGLYSVTLSITGPGGSSDLTKNDSVFIYEPGQNPVRIRTRPLTANSVEITLSNLQDIHTLIPHLTCTSLGIWIKKGDTPSDSSDGSLVTAYPFSSLRKETLVDTITLTDTSDTIYGFMTGIFWSDNTLSEFNTGNGTLLLRVLPKTSNIISLDTLYVDSLNACLRIAWCIHDSFATDSSEVVISRSFDGYDDESADKQHIVVSSECVDTIVDLGGPLLFDTTYYISLRLHLENGVWLEPTDSSRASLRIGRLQKQKVTLLNNDTVPLLNNSIVVWNDKTDKSDEPYVDTIEIQKGDYDANGFITVGSPFIFKKAAPSIPITVGVPVTSLPEGRSLSEVMLYRDDDKGIAVFHHTRHRIEDSMVFVKSDELEGMLVAMIDTTEPVVKLRNDIDGSISAGTTVTDSLTISDNVVNCTWEHFCSSGDKPGAPVDSDVLSAAKSTIGLSVKKDSPALSSRYGLRSYVTISDGHQKITVNLSRSVKRTKSDEQSIPAQKWVPLFPTAQVRDTALSSLIDRLPTVVHDDGYDPRQTRLFRWVQYSENKSSGDKWVEYNRSSKSIRSLFTIEPGKIIWLKSRLKATVHFDEAHTLSLSDTFTVTIPKRQWIDLGNPYSFTIPLQAILTATDVKQNVLLIYQWKKAKSSGVYSLHPLYVPQLTNYDDPDITFEGGTNGVFSFYNRSLKDITLRIPPVPVGTELDTKIAKRKNATSWSVVFSAVVNDTKLPPVCCGYTPGEPETTLPLSPSFSKIRLSIFERQEARQYGHFITGTHGNGIAKEILLRNSTDTAVQLKYHTAADGSFPENYRFLTFDPSDGSTDSAGTIRLAPHTTSSRYLVTGDTDFIDHFAMYAQPSRYALQSVYAHPGKNMVTIRYTVPLGSLEQLEVTVFNVLGKKVWTRALGSLLPAGEQALVWNGVNNHETTAGAGLYIVRLTIRNTQGRVIRRFHRPVTFVR